LSSTRNSRSSLGAILIAAAFLLPSCGRPAAASFEGKRAYDWVARQVAFGPRAPGTAAHDSCFALLYQTLRGYTPLVEADTFRYRVPKLDREVTLYNLLARFEPQASQRILLGAHWDTRPWADMDPDPARRDQPILGANDGGSGVAVLMELARVMHESRPAIGVDIVLFDGEDLGTDEDPSGWFRGSKRFVIRHAGTNPPLFAVVVDMVGRRDLALHWEGNSYDRAGNIVDLVWGVARKMNIRAFRSDVRATVFDDHVPFLNAGIPAIVLIDFPFPEWHTHGDDLSIIDPASLEAVGRVLHRLVSDPTFLDD
jgi:Zn-dependent M28 family amino/carboxypeptidase